MANKCKDCPDPAVTTFPKFDLDVDPLPYCKRCLTIRHTKSKIKFNERTQKGKIDG